MAVRVQSETMGDDGSGNATVPGCADVCVYGACSKGECDCIRGFFTAGSHATYGTGSLKADGMGGGYVQGEQCNVSVADVFFGPWLGLRILWGLAYLCLLICSLVFIRRLLEIRRRRRRKQRHRSKRLRLCSVRMVTFSLIATACFLRLLWNCVDPIGAFFIMSPRATVATLEQRAGRLMLLRFYDQTLNTLGYLLQWSTAFEIASFWVRVALRFQEGDRTDKFWGRFLLGMQVAVWAPLLTVNILIGVSGYLPGLVLAFNGIILVGVVAMVVTMITAYCTVHRRTVGVLSLPILREALRTTPKPGTASTPGTPRGRGGDSGGKNAFRTSQLPKGAGGTSRHSARSQGTTSLTNKSRSHERNVRNMGNMLRLVIYTQSWMVVSGVIVVGLVASDWSKTPTGYLVNIGVLVRILEFLYMAAISGVMRVKATASTRKPSPSGGLSNSGAGRGTSGTFSHKNAAFGIRRPNRSTRSDPRAGRETQNSTSTSDGDTGWIAQLERKDLVSMLRDSGMTTRSTQESLGDAPPAQAGGVAVAMTSVGSTTGAAANDAAGDMA